MSVDWRRYQHDPALFIDEYMPLNEKGKAWKLAPHQRRVLSLAFSAADEGRLEPLRMLLWSELKKSGKTLLAAALGLWWSFTRPHTEVKAAANDLEQSVGRVFKTMVKLLEHNPILGKSAKVKAACIELSNGTVIDAIASDYKGAAGSRHSLVIYDELWGYTSESAQRLYEELTPPPTEPDAWVLVVTYAGFSGESTLLEHIYERGLKGERLDEDLEVFRAPGGLLMFWSHTPRQPWQTPEYYAEQRISLRPNAYARLHENMWVTGESPFITESLWDACVVPGLTPSLSSERIEAGVDLGIKNDNAAVVAVAIHGSQVRLVAHRIWRPTKADPIDIEATVEAYLLELSKRHHLMRAHYDPYQFHRSATTLKQRGLRMEEYPQTPANLTQMGQNLYELFTGRNLQIYEGAADLRQHALNAVAVESTRGWRIAKEKSSKKIDGCVALAMACVNSVEHGFKGPAIATITKYEPFLGRPGEKRPGEKYSEVLAKCAAADKERAENGEQEGFLRKQGWAGIAATLDRMGRPLDPTASATAKRVFERQPGRR